MSRMIKMIVTVMLKGVEGIFRTGDVWERNITFSVCPRTRVVPYGWHRFWLMHAYFVYMFRLHVWDSRKQKIIPDIYINLDKWDMLEVFGGAYMYLQ